MKKVTMLLVMVLMGLTGYAQTEGSQAGPTVLKYGFLSMDSVLVAMPEYAEMKNQMAMLRSQYEAEQKRVEDDFNKTYEDFLDGQATFPKTILQKRQSELQEMLDKNIAFKRESQQLLANAEAEMMATLKTSIAAVLTAIGQKRGYAFILNTDKEAVPFINPAQGEDITEAVKQLLNEK